MCHSCLVSWGSYESNEAIQFEEAIHGKNFYLSISLHKTKLGLQKKVFMKKKTVLQKNHHINLKIISGNCWRQ